MKLISWNVNGIRACIGKGFEESFAALDADIFCLQETKCQQGQVELELPGYHQYWNYANRRGYSGTAVFTKKEPISVAYGLGIEEHDKEGRVITLEFENFYLVTVYTPNSQSELRRLEYRMHWEEDFLAYLLKLQESKPVICCGDFNVAHQEMYRSDEIIPASDYPDMQELMAAADVMITDYSGSMFEFMLTGRPVFLFAGDLSAYLAKERELYFSFKELPFSLAEDEDQLGQNIRAFDTEKYRTACMQFMEHVGMEEDGKGAQVLAERIIEQIHGEQTDH